MFGLELAELRDVCQQQAWDIQLHSGKASLPSSLQTPLVLGSEQTSWFGVKLSQKAAVTKPFQSIKH
jgi:hypothetical protein